MGFAARALVLVAVAGCAVGDVESMRPQNTPRACYASFEVAVEGWEAFMGPLPAECLHLDEVYTIELSSGPMPCKASDPGRVIGCTEYDPHRITLRAGLGEEKTVNIAVHEWMHALSACAGVSADDNAHHADERIWGEDPHTMSFDLSGLLDPQSARAYALGASGVGPCLE